MSEEKDNTQEVEVKETETIEVKPEETPKEKTVSELLNDEDKKTVPLSTFLDTKKEKKELERTILSLQEQIKNGATKKEVASDLKDLADKYDVNPEFLKELTETVYRKAKEDVEESLNSKLQPLEAKEKAERLDKIFNEHFDKVIEEMPEYENVINKSVIKALTLLPENANKTFQQVIEETYGKTVSGKKTMETSTPRGGKETSLDFSKMNDPAYYKEVMSNPDLKKKYNEGLSERIKL